MDVQQASCSGSAHKKKKAKTKAKKRKLKDSSSSSEDSDHESKRRKKVKRKRKSSCSSSSSYEKRKKHKKKKKHKHKSNKDNNSKTIDKSTLPEHDIGPSVLEARKKMAPMTKEEWDKQQSQVRRVFDPETGRNRLIKGDGEVLEEIVSKDRHKEINKAATFNDGEYFKKQMGLQ